MVTVVVGLIGIYIVFALITSHITEAIAAIFKQRGETLYRGIVAIVGDETSGKLVEQMYRHPLISSLSSGPKEKPTYIPARAFSLSLLDEVRTIFTRDANGAPIPLPDLLAAPEELFADAVKRIEGMQDGQLKQTFTAIIQNVDHKYESLLHGVDTLFDASMQRVSGWYKRWSAVVVFTVGAVLVAAFNVDTLSIVRELAQNQAKAQALADMAQQLSNFTAFAQLLNSLPLVSFSWTSAPEFGWWLKIAGLLLTLFAVMLGAPFWFNLLQRLVPVRLTGDKPAVTSIPPPDRDVLDVQSASSAAR